MLFHHTQIVQLNRFANACFIYNNPCPSIKNTSTLSFPAQLLMDINVRKTIIPMSIFLIFNQQQKTSSVAGFFDCNIPRQDGDIYIMAMSMPMQKKLYTYNSH
mmetsp:Transcript_35903/g.75532  ORF Transcript_35903/g.75532 Transcript_35903/m.75532 type:complete len:103 (-) Transcript_35903:475-783(-)